MSTASLYVAYDGPALASHEINVRDLAPALLALSDMFEEANTILNADRAKITLNVKGSFKTGSFGIDLSVCQSIMQSLLNIGANPDVQSAATIATLLGLSANNTVKYGVLQALRWIRGRKVDKVEVSGTIATIYIGEEFFEVEERILKLLRNQRIRKAIDDAIKKPLQTEGIDSFGFTDRQGEKEGKIGIITKNEAEYYLAPKPEPEDLGETAYDTTLQIVGVTFQEKNKWRFSDGISNTFYADMLDDSFMARIDNHSILFGKGDIIRARVCEKKVIDASGTMKAERAIVHVFEHRNASAQLSLFKKND